MAFGYGCSVAQPGWSDVGEFFGLGRSVPSSSRAYQTTVQAPHYDQTSPADEFVQMLPVLPQQTTGYSSALPNTRLVKHVKEHFRNDFILQRKCGGLRL